MLAMDVFLLSILILLHPMYGVYLLCKRKFPSAVFRILLPFITLSCLNVKTIGYRPHQSSTETFRQSLTEGNIVAYLGILAAFLWIMCMIVDIRSAISWMNKRIHKKSHPMDD